MPDFKEIAIGIADRSGRRAAAGYPSLQYVALVDDVMAALSQAYEEGLMCQADLSAKCEPVSQAAPALQSGSTEDAEEYDYDGLPHPEIRQLVSKLERCGTGLDEDVWIALRGEKSTALPTEYLSCALSLIPENWWWHISHLEASIIPTTPAEGSETVLSNSTAYDKQGRPISYRSSAHYDRGQLPRAICAALLKAKYNLPPAFSVKATATEEEPADVIQARQERVTAFRNKHRRQIEEPQRGDTGTAEQREASLTHKITQEDGNG